MRNQKTYLLLALLWTCLVTVLSLITISTDVGSAIHIENKDKFVHFAFYFVFVILWCQFVKSYKLTNKTKLVVLFSAVSYGILMEICQGLFTTTRTADILDVLANSFGAIVGLIVFLLLNKTKEATR